jgi:hypothetical protein
MKIFKAFRQGSVRSLRAWRGILITWFASLLTVSLVVLPMRGALNSGFGKSMVTEKLRDGLNLEVLSDLSSGLKSVVSSFISGFFLLILFGMIVNAFLAGGLFDSIKSPARKISASEFFRASARNFLTFFVISLIISVIIISLAFIIVGIPLSIVKDNKTASEAAPFVAAIISGSVLAVVIIIFMLVADFARAWQARNEKQKCLKALVFGFSRTFRTFFSSFPTMLIDMAVIVLFMFLTINLLGPWRPITSGGVFLLFILSQAMFIINLFLKTWSYGCVTSLMEQTDPTPDEAFFKMP